MASRGGRGGRFGGRGGGRFGGRGAATGPVARDDEGNILPNQVEGPPPLFPEAPLPPPLEATAKERVLLLRKRDLLSSWKASPFFIEPTKVAKRKEADFHVPRYSDKEEKKPKKARLPLTAVMTLVPEYFPEELYSAQEKRAAQRLKLGQPQGSYWSGHAARKAGGGALDRIDQLAQLEGKMEEEEGGKNKPGEGEDPGEEEDVVVDTDDDEVMEEDDYYQGEHFDDDEGYDDYDDGGGDDGPIF